MPHRLDRPPHDAGAPEMLEVTELPYAQALEATAFKQVTWRGYKQYAS